MKKYFILIALLSTFIGFSQTINDYKYAIVPSKFSFLKEKDAYRLNNLTKLFMEKYGFVTYYDTDSLPVELANQNCNKVYLDVLSKGNMFTTKLTIVIKDCQNKILFTSVEGKSREKEYKVAYTQALREAFASFAELNYKYEEKTNHANDNNNNENLNENKSINNPIILFAQPITNGFQLIDNTPSVVMKIYNTSVKDCYIATKASITGILVSKEGKWFFEYYENEKLISELIEVKF